MKQVAPGVVEYGDSPAPQASVQRVSMRQARLALDAVGKLDAVTAAIASIPDPIERRKAQISWEYASEVERNNPLLASISASIGLTASDLDDLFNAAALIP